MIGQPRQHAVIACRSQRDDTRLPSVLTAPPFLGYDLCHATTSTWQTKRAEQDHSRVTGNPPPGPQEQTGGKQPTNLIRWLAPRL